MKLYATRTGTRRNNEALDRLGFGRVISHIAKPSPSDLKRRYGVDNGAWTAFQAKTQWIAPEWQDFVWKYGSRADWVVAPDIVANPYSLRLTESWLGWLEHLPREVLILIAVQDGMTPSEVSRYLGGRRGIFVGGSTEWKDKTIRQWSQLARELGCWIHVGRVNTLQRLQLCQLCGVDSCDGTGASMFALHAAKMARWNQQVSLPVLALNGTANG